MILSPIHTHTVLIHTKLTQGGVITAVNTGHRCNTGRRRTNSGTRITDERLCCDHRCTSWRNPILNPGFPLQWTIKGFSSLIKILSISKTWMFVYWDIMIIMGNALYGPSELKGTLSPKFSPPYMNDIAFLNIIHKVNISFSPPFTPKIGDLAENVRQEGPKNQAKVSCSGLKNQAMSLL